MSVPSQWIRPARAVPSQGPGKQILDSARRVLVALACSLAAVVPLRAWEPAPDGLLPANASAQTRGGDDQRDAWRGGDTIRELAFTALTLCDWGQTLNIVDRSCPRLVLASTTTTQTATGLATDNHYVMDFQEQEKNPILGRFPHRAKVNEYFASIIVGHYLVARAIPIQWRGWFQGVTIGVEAECITRNKVSLGLSIAF